MGWVVWLCESLLCLAASYAVAAAVYPDRGALDRGVVVLLVDPALILTAMQLCGIPGHLSPWPLGLTSLALFGGVFALAVRSLGRERLLALLHSDVRAPLRLWHDLRRTPEIAILALVPAVVVFGVCCLMVWYFRSWTWDPVWYHVPKTSYFVQDHTLALIPTPESRTQYFAHNIELLAAWNCLFQSDNRLDDSSQLPFAVLGVLVVAAWARKLGASRPLAAGLGAAWLALPPVFLQAHSTHNDIACGVLFAAAVYFARDTPTRRDRWMAMIAVGLYVGTKYTGLFHALLLAPWFAARAGYELWKRRGARLRTLGDVALSVGALLVVGIFKYVQNVLLTRNPLYPFPLRVPIVHWDLPATTDPEFLYGAPPGQSPAFFNTPNGFTQMVTSWLDPNPFYCPDVRTGGFGAVFRWLLVPCVVAVAVDVVRLRGLRRGLPIVALFVGAVVVPAPWFPRYIIGGSIAAVVAFALVHVESNARWMRGALSLALVGLVCAGAQAGYKGFITYPRDFARATQAQGPAARAALKIDTFLWDTEWAMQRERELRAGDVVAYDDSVHFLQDLFCWDYRTRVTYVPSTGDPAAYVARLRALRARWVGVTHGSAAARALAQAGGEFLFVTPVSSMAMYRTHW